MGGPSVRRATLQGKRYIVNRIAPYFVARVQGGKEGVAVNCTMIQ